MCKKLIFILMCGRGQNQSPQIDFDPKSKSVEPILIVINIRCSGDQNVKTIEMSRAGAHLLIIHKVRKTRFFEDVSSEGAIFEKNVAVIPMMTPPSKTTLKAIWPLSSIHRRSRKRSLFDDVSIESAILMKTMMPKRSRNRVVSCGSAFFN